MKSRVKYLLFLLFTFITPQMVEAVVSISDEIELSKLPGYRSDYTSFENAMNSQIFLMQSGHTQEEAIKKVNKAIGACSTKLVYEDAQEYTTQKISVITTAILELLHFVCEGYAINHMNSKNPDEIRKTALVSSIANALKSVNAIGSIATNRGITKKVKITRAGSQEQPNTTPAILRKTIMSLTGKSLSSAIVDLFFAHKSLTKYSNALKIAANKRINKVKKSDNKVKQWTWLAINALCVLYPFCTLTATISKKKQSGDTVTIFNNYLAVLCAFGNISEFFRKKSRYNHEFNDFEDMIDTKEMKRELRKLRKQGFE